MFRISSFLETFLNELRLKNAGCHTHTHTHTHTHKFFFLDGNMRSMHKNGLCCGLHLDGRMGSLHRSDLRGMASLGGGLPFERFL